MTVSLGSLSWRINEHPASVPHTHKHTTQHIQRSVTFRTSVNEYGHFTSISIFLRNITYSSLFGWLACDLAQHHCVQQMSAHGTNLFGKLFPFLGICFLFKVLLGFPWTGCAISTYYMRYSGDKNKLHCCLPVLFRLHQRICLRSKQSRRNGNEACGTKPHAIIENLLNK